MLNNALLQMPHVGGESGAYSRHILGMNRWRDYASLRQYWSAVPVLSMLCFVALVWRQLGRSFFFLLLFGCVIKSLIRSGRALAQVLFHLLAWWQRSVQPKPDFRRRSPFLRLVHVSQDSASFAVTTRSGVSHRVLWRLLTVHRNSGVFPRWKQSTALKTGSKTSFTHYP